MATLIEKNTARLMLRKLQAQLDGLYQEQEASKQTSALAEQMKCGGKVKRKKMFGGGTPNTHKRQPIIAGLSKTPTTNTLSPMTPNPNAYQNTKGDWKSGFTGWERLLGKGSQALDWGKDNAGNMAYNAAALAPTIYNTIQGMRKPDLMDPKDFYNPYANKAMGLMANRRVNIDPQLNANKAGQANYNRNVIDASGGSRSKVLGNLGAGLNQRMAGDATAYAQKQNMDLGYMGEEAQFMYGAGQDMANVNFGVAGMNQEAEAARRGYLGQAASDLSGFAQTNRLMNNQKDRDQQLRELLPDIFGKVADFMPWINK